LRISGETLVSRSLPRLVIQTQLICKLIVGSSNVRFTGVFPWTRMSVAEGALRAVSGVVVRVSMMFALYCSEPGRRQRKINPEGTITVISNPPCPATPTRIHGKRNWIVGKPCPWVMAPNELQRDPDLPQHGRQLCGGQLRSMIRGSLPVSRPAFTKSPTAGTCFYWPYAQTRPFRAIALRRHRSEITNRPNFSNFAEQGESHGNHCGSIKHGHA